MCNDRHKRNFPIQEGNEFSRDRLTKKGYHLTTDQNEVIGTPWDSRGAQLEDWASIPLPLVLGYHQDLSLMGLVASGQLFGGERRNRILMLSLKEVAMRSA